MAMNQLRYGAGSVVVGEEGGGGEGHPSQYHQPGANDSAPAPIAAAVIAAAVEKGVEVKREHPGAGEDTEEEEAARKMQRRE